ncbi:MAG: hypothetical protein AAFY41_13360 [Bacteroidota bacterium]
MGRNKTVKTKDFRKVMAAWGLTLIRTKGSHESWSKPGMTRPVIIQASKKTIHLLAFKNNLRTVGKSESQFFETLDTL